MSRLKFQLSPQQETPKNVVLKHTKQTEGPMVRTMCHVPMDSK